MFVFKMQSQATIVLLVLYVYGGGGVTKTSGIEQFWTDDYKVFDQIYGKTSDKHIYGETLPPSITFNSDQKIEASKKNERYLMSLNQDSEELDPYNYADRYNNLLSNQALNLYNKKKPATSSINFVSYKNFKPISQSNDPETYSYLKHLEELNKNEEIGYNNNIAGFKPYLNYEGEKPEDTDAYKSIQDILDAHEANKGSSYKNEEDNVKHLNSGKNKKKKPPRIYHDVTKSRCGSGRCRKRVASTYRTRRRPIVRGLKKVLVA